MLVDTEPNLFDKDYGESWLRFDSNLTVLRNRFC